MRHECAVPSAGNTKWYKTWQCPVCKKKWDFAPNQKLKTGVFLWGKRNIRDRHGNKP